ncbi:alginate biosynthesis protein AlgK, partial [Pseudomonas citronellolis]|uniref:alginate biosynthesis protein AlgK n=1 Tax=Pseudomonas citronellolis TaxID=53408 RepID=UPI0023E38121
GDSATAERNYQALADLGYPDASLKLADLQVRSGDPAALIRAEALYRQAAQSSAQGRVPLGKWLAAKPGASDAERYEAEQLLTQALNEGDGNLLLPLLQLYLQYPQNWPSTSPQQRVDRWRAQGFAQAPLAQVALYRAQGSIAQHLDEIERTCRQALAQMDLCWVELASVYQLQGATQKQQDHLQRLGDAYRAGRLPAERVQSVAEVLADPSLGTPDPKAAQALLDTLTPRYPAAWIALAKLQYGYPELGDVEQLLGYLKQGHDAAPSRAELLLGRLYYDGRWLPRDPQEAERHLLAATAGEPQAHYYLGQIYRRGYLGKVYPQKAVDHLIVAARAGNAHADLALAQLWSQGRGIKPNPGFAYVFARIAQGNQLPDATPLLAQLQTQLSPAARQQAETLLGRELGSRGAPLAAAPGRPPTTQEALSP